MDLRGEGRRLPHGGLQGRRPRPTGEQEQVDHTRRYPDIAAAVARLKPSTLVLDGEVAVFVDQLRSRFEWLRDPDDSVVATPPVLVAFDVLYVKGRDVSQRPLRERRTRLEAVVAGAGLHYPVRRLAPDGLDAWAEAVERGFEGLVAKDEASAYESGRTMWWDGRGGSLAAEDQRGAVARAGGEMNDTAARLWHLEPGGVAAGQGRVQEGARAGSQIRRAGWFIN